MTSKNTFRLFKRGDGRGLLWFACNHNQYLLLCRPRRKSGRHVVILRFFLLFLLLLFFHTFLSCWFLGHALTDLYETLYDDGIWYELVHCVLEISEKAAILDFGGHFEFLADFCILETTEPILTKLGIHVQQPSTSWLDKKKFREIQNGHPRWPPNFADFSTFTNLDINWYSG